MTPRDPHHRQHSRRGAPLRLSRRHEGLLVVVAALLLLSGLGWVLVHDVIARPDEFGVVHSPLEPWLLRVHGAATMAALLLLGSLLREHMITAWRLKRHRWSGGTLVATCLVLVATGYALYYLASDELRPSISLLHWIVGLAALPAFLVHRSVGRRRRNTGRDEHAAVGDRRAAAQPVRPR